MRSGPQLGPLQKSRLILLQCGTFNRSFERLPMLPPLPIEIDCDTLKRRLDAKDDLSLLDCREASEFETCRIAGATLFPMSELTARVSELEPYKNREIVVHCHHGGRSLRVAGWLRKNGFELARSLAGGIDQWSLEIDPTVPRY